MDWMEQEQSAALPLLPRPRRRNGRAAGSILSIPLGSGLLVEVERSLRVLDGTVAVFCAKGGVEPQSETVWRQAEKYGVPRLAYINKMDILGADFYNVVDMMKTRLGANPVRMQPPIGKRGYLYRHH